MIYSRYAPRTWAAVLCSAAALLFCASAMADPPARVARLGQIAGSVTFSPAGEEDWVLAQTNRPFITGDRVWSDAGSHAELQMGGAAVRLGANTSVAILNLDDNIAQLQLAQGTLNVRVRQIYGEQFYEIDTPNLAFSIRRAGDYRIDVDPNGNATIISVRAGQGEAWGEGAAYVIGAGQQYTFVGEGLRDYSFAALPPLDEFDRWSFDRNRREDATVSARYVAPEVIGYSDLDEYGTWRSVEGYGNVWVPTRVEASWAPYHFGHWGWVEPWGWTWLDDAPWGFAPFHYGRWAYLSSHWCWVPGPIAVRPVYAPALVVFVGGGGFSLSAGVAGVAWFPLGPGEVYRPSYAVSRGYFNNINVSNTVVNTTVINNVYNNVNVTNIVYRNREVAGAITAVPTNAFASGEPVSRHAVQVSRDVIAREQVTHVAAVAPSHAAVIAAGLAVAGGAAAVAAHRPPATALSRQVVAKSAPPAPTPSFAARSSQLASQPGRPLEAEKLKGMRTERASEAPKVKMVAPSVTPQPLAKGAAPQGGQQERKGGPQGAPGGQPPQGGQAQEERFKERKGPPQGAPVPQPPASAQERFKGPPQGAPGGPPPQGGQAQEERFKERRGGPPQGAPAGQPPADQAPQERRGGPPQGAPGGPPPQGGQAPQERRGGPPEGAPSGPPPQGGQAPQERRGGPPQGAPSGPPPQGGQAPQERRGGPPQGAPSGPPPQGGQAPQERRGGPPQGAPSGPPPQGGQAPQERRGGPPQGAPGGPPPQGGQAPQERGRESRGGPPPQAGPPPQPPPQQQQQIQKGPPQPAPPQAGRPEPKREEGKGKEGKEKDKERPPGQ